MTEVELKQAYREHLNYGFNRLALSAPSSMAEPLLKVPKELPNVLPIVSQDGTMPSRIEV